MIHLEGRVQQRSAASTRRMVSRCSQPSVEELAAHLHGWTTANPGRPVVGPDWQPFIHDEALQDIRARAAEGRAVTLEETWLDGGPALRMNRTFRPGGALLVHENAFEGPGWTG